MTLKRVQAGSSYPFLRPFEAEFAKRGKIVQVRQGKTKFKDEQIFVDLKLAKTPTSSEYKKWDLQDVDTRLEDPTRTWAINGKSLNHYIDEYGDQEDEWIGKDAEFQVENQIVRGKKTDVIYAKGSI